MSKNFSLEFRDLSKSDFDGNTVYFKWVGESDRLNEILVSLSGANCKEDIVRIVSKIRCFYTFVVVLDDLVVLCGDHLKTIPLYYSMCDGQVIIGDNFQDLSKKFGSSILSSEALLEMQILGYVLGEKTYLESIKQVRAGEVLCIDIVRGTVEGLDHFMFSYLKPETNLDFLERNFHRLIEESIGSLIRYANGRQIVIPLSGGYDSRLILSILCKFGYKNLLCFTYGVRGNKESAYSKFIAETFDVNWEMVTYDNETWKDWDSETSKMTQLSIGQGYSIPHMQDYAAIQSLLADGRIDKDAIIVPGHSGDFIAGSHLPKDCFEKISFSNEELVSSIIKKHFRLIMFESLSDREKDYLSLQVRRAIQNEDILNDWSFASEFDNWDWRERQAKFIGNSIRVYEEFGLDWYLPLWDRYFVDFWKSVPLSMKENRWWYKEQVIKTYDHLSASNKELQSIGNATNNTNPIIAQLKSFLKSSSIVLYKVLFALYQRYRLKVHPLDPSLRYDSSEVVELLSRGYNFNGITAYFYIQLLREDRQKCGK